ncbi:MAG: outer membrane protein assembly factor BamE [Rhodocyclales bacterium]|nr:outer membrane protein assembly factor BamE [Rhodocyclales bacterium]
MQSPTFLTVLAVVGLLAGCSFDKLASGIQPYRIDVRQGNYVDQEMVSQLKKGMTRDQVRFVLGTPLVVDPFRTDRWDYVYLFRPGRGEGLKRTVSVFFVADRLDHVDGDVAAATDGASEAAPQPVERSRVIEISAPEEKK